jgi:hypothetical protein
MSFTDESPHAAQDPNGNSARQDPNGNSARQPPADPKPREWPLVVGMVAVALALLLALIYVAWWYVARYMFD